MSENEKSSKKINPIGSGRPDISAVDVAIVNLEKEISSVKNELNTQRSEGKNIIYAVLFAFVSIVVVIAIQVSYANRKDAQFYSQLEKDVYEQNLRVQDINNKFDNLKVRNWL